MSLREDAERVIGAAVLAEHQADELLLTVKEYASLFGLNVQTVYSAARLGHRLYGRVIRPSARSIRIAVPRGTIQGLKSASTR